MSHPFAAQAADLSSLEQRGRRRALASRTGMDFSSNDYLGLAESAALAQAAQAALSRGVAIGSGGSRLLRGNGPEHEALEAEAAAFFGRESALFLGSGFAANAALLATLPQRGDVVVADELVHASVHEGLRLSRAETRLVPHNDAQAFADAIAAWRASGATGKAWFAVESLYSMDGDFAPLGSLAEVAARHDAVLLVDEAHATGVFGPSGRGLAAELPGRERIVTLHTCGKALGVEGALICGPAVVRDFLVNRARGFIFSTAPSPLIAAVVRAAMRLVEAGDDLRADLRTRFSEAERLLVPLGAQAHGSPILPLVIGDDRRTMAVAARLQAEGFDVRGIRPPTVLEGTSRLRIVVTRNVQAAQIAALAEALEAAL